MAAGLVRRRLVMTRRVMLPVRGRVDLLLHQQPAIFMPQDLPVGHAVAGADRLLGKMQLVDRPMMRGRVPLVGWAMMRGRAPMVRPRGVMARARSVMTRAA